MRFEPSYAVYILTTYIGREMSEYARIKVGTEPLMTIWQGCLNICFWSGKRSRFYIVYQAQYLNVGFLSLFALLCDCVCFLSLIKICMYTFFLSFYNPTKIKYKTLLYIHQTHIEMIFKSYVFGALLIVIVALTLNPSSSSVSASHNHPKHKHSHHSLRAKRDENNKQCGKTWDTCESTKDCCKGYYCDKNGNGAKSCSDLRWLIGWLECRRRPLYIGAIDLPRLAYVQLDVYSEPITYTLNIEMKDSFAPALKQFSHLLKTRELSVECYLN